MNRDKQIEEMAKAITEKQEAGWEYVNGSEYTTDVFNHELAEHLYNRGYRKSTDVAREIFDEIEDAIEVAVSTLQFENNPIHRKIKHEIYSSLMGFIKTFIEKKYMEDNDGKT